MIHKALSPGVLAGIAFMLAGCAAPELEKRISSVNNQMIPGLNAGAMPLPTGPLMVGSASMAEELARQQIDPPVAMRAKQPWYGTRMVAVQSDELLPPVFYERFTFDFDDRMSGGRVPIEVVAERIYRITNVPVRISADVNGNGLSSQAPPAPGQPPAIVMPMPGSSTNRPGQPLLSPLPLGGAPVETPKQSSEPTRTSLPLTDLNAIEMRWRDRDMVSFLNTVTDRLGLGWSYRDGVVMIHRYVTETFELGAFGSSQDYALSISGASNGAAGGNGGAGGSSSSQLQVTETGKSSPLQSIVKTVTTMLESVKGSSVTLSEGTSRLTVTTTKESMRHVRSMLKQEQESMNRQVMIQIDIYSLSSTNSNDSGVNLQVLFQNLQKTFGVSLAGPTTGVTSEAGGLALNILSVLNGGNPNSNTVKRFGNSALMLQALHQNGISVQHQPLNMIAMNRQWARKTNLKQTGYLSETTPSTVAGAGSGAPGLKTSTITTGDRFIVQPAILDNGTVLLKFGVSLTNLLGLFDVTAGAGATLQKVQTPEVSGTDDQSTVMLRAGEVMVLTGLSRIKSNHDARSLGENVPIVLGGSSKMSQSREDFVIFVRPVIL
jgi:type IVB pilus formation R64 PilN family outer membrane protein